MAELGNSAVGGSTTTSQGGYTAYYKVTAAATFTATKVLVYASSSSGSVSTQLGIYSDSSNSPDTRLGYGTVNITTTPGWFEVTLDTPASIVSGSVYWLANANGSDINIKAAAGTQVALYKSGTTLDTTASVGGSIDGSGTLVWSIYATDSGGSDTTAPVLTTPVGTQTGSTTATIGATTDEGNGTLYGVVTTSSTTPTATQVAAGQDAAGSAAAFAGSTSVGSTGAKTVSATGLTASTAYYAHLMHEDAAGNKSNVVTSSQFTTAATSVTASTLTFTSSSTAGPKLTWGAFTNNTGSVTYYVHRSTTPNFTPSGTTAGSGTCIAASASSPYTDGTAAADTNYHYKVVGTDTTPTSDTTNQVVGTVWADPIVLGMIGDSNGTGYGATGTTPIDECATLLAKSSIRPRTVTVSNQASVGATSADWASGGGAVSVFNTAGVTHVVIMLGSNPTSSASAFQTEIQSLVDTLLADVPTLQKIFLSYAPYVGPGGYFSRNVDIVASNAKLELIANGTTVFVIGRNVYSYIAEAGQLQGDGLHLGTAGDQSVGAMWANDIDANFYPSTSAGVRLINFNGGY